MVQTSSYRNNFTANCLIPSDPWETCLREIRGNNEMEFVIIIKSLISVLSQPLLFSAVFTLAKLSSVEYFFWPTKNLLKTSLSMVCFYDLFYRRKLSIIRYDHTIIHYFSKELGTAPIPAVSMTYWKLSNFWFFPRKIYQQDNLKINKFCH